MSMAKSLSVNFQLLLFLIAYILEVHEAAPHGKTILCTNQPKEELLRPPQCGYINAGFVSRVVGGSPAKVAAWPWIATIGYETNETNKNAFKCGGSLISSRHVLTAAHCVSGGNNPLFVRLGEYDLSSDDDEAIDILIEEAIIHPDYDQDFYVNDIAILVLAQEVKFTDTIHPICLPIDDEIKNRDFVNNYLHVAGWGRSSTGGPLSSVLLETLIPVVNYESCKYAYRNVDNAVVDDRVICAGYEEGGKDSCEGDSGGPMIFQLQQSYYLVGVVSGGYGRCAEPGIPGLYTRVTSFMDFILFNINLI